ncbi:MAG: hypothetical protein JWM37_820 [Candidatus Saccharibacteria bacterium]|nr:hypothetical protein [Candidatus Saccharibacteria bacterium]
MQYMTAFQILLLFAIIGLLLRRQSTTGQPEVKKKAGQKIILDSCALIDGRIIAITEAGFGAEELIVPEFIVHELQLLADGHDAHKRERARFGLDVVQQLQSNEQLTVILDTTRFDDIQHTDDKLVALAKKLNARLYTTDFNLNKVAAVTGVQVLNVNELAQSLRPEALPGETKQIKLLQKGQGREQAVGYLDDGTMVVVDKARTLIGKSVTVVVERMHQTVAGKMVFAHLQKPLKSKD